MDTRNEKNTLFHIILKLVNSGKCLWNVTSRLVLWVKNHLQVDVMLLNVLLVLIRWTTWQDLICTSEGYCVIRLSGSQHPGDHFEISTPSRSWPGVPRVIQSPRRITFWRLLWAGWTTGRRLLDFGRPLFLPPVLLAQIPRVCNECVAAVLLFLSTLSHI